MSAMQIAREKRDKSNDHKGRNYNSVRMMTSNSIEKTGHPHLAQAPTFWAYALDSQTHTCTKCIYIMYAQGLMTSDDQWWQRGHSEGTHPAGQIPSKAIRAFWIGTGSLRYNLFCFDKSYVLPWNLHVNDRPLLQSLPWQCTRETPHAMRSFAIKCTEARHVAGKDSHGDETSFKRQWWQLQNNKALRGCNFLIPFNPFSIIYQIFTPAMLRLAA